MHLIVEGRQDEARALLDRTVPIHRDPGHAALPRRPGMARRRPPRPRGRPLREIAGRGAGTGRSAPRARPGPAAAAAPRGRRAATSSAPARPTCSRDVDRTRPGARAPGRWAGATRPARRSRPRPVLADTDAPTALALGDLALQLGRSGHGACASWRTRCAEPRRWPPPTRASASRSSGSGRAGEAITALEEACRLDPSDPTAPYNLALLYARAGRLEEARRLGGARAGPRSRLAPSAGAARRAVAPLRGGRRVASICKQLNIDDLRLSDNLRADH